MAGNLQIHSSDLSGYQQYKIHLLKKILLFNKHRAKSLRMQVIWVLIAGNNLIYCHMTTLGIILLFS